MEPIIISSDSPCDLPLELTLQHQIPIFHLPVMVGEDTRADGDTISAAGIFTLYEEQHIMARTVAASIAAYKTHFESILEDHPGASIIHFVLSSDITSGYNSAGAAAKTLNEEGARVDVIDSRSLSVGMGALVLKAVDFRDGGMGAEEIVSTVNDLRAKVNTSFVLDTLEYMRRGGRCSAVQALGANLLKLKPCIEMPAGALVVGKKYRGKMADVLTEYTDERLRAAKDPDFTRAFIAQSGRAEGLLAPVEKRLRDAGFREVVFGSVGATVAVHCGPGTVGVIFIDNGK